MKIYLVSLSVGVLVGLIYGLLNVRSPAPPVIALIGLLGILAGEQVVPLARRLAAGGAADVAWLQHQAPHVFGRLPTAREALGPTPDPVADSTGRDHHA